jgi:phage FluMu protein Com
MPIEFRCTSCRRLLRVPDDAAGKRAQCPECRSIETVPSSTAAHSAGGGPAGTTGGASAGAGPLGPVPGGTPPSAEQVANPFAVPPPETPAASLSDFNPYQAPLADDARFAVAAGPKGPLVPTPIELADVIRCTWTIWKNNLGLCVGVFAAVTIMGTVVNQVGNVAVQIMEAARIDPIYFFIVLIPLWLGMAVFEMWLAAGQARFFLRTARGEGAEFVDVFRGGPYLIRLFVTGLLLMLLTALSMALFVGVPAALGYAASGDNEVAGLAALAGGALFLVLVVYFAIVWSQWYFLIVDRDVGSIDALRLSAMLLSENKLTVFLLVLVAGLLRIAGICPGMCIGLFFTGSFADLMLAVAFLRMGGQQVAA